MNIIVLGYTGFVGSVIYNYLKEQGHRVSGIGRLSHHSYRVCDIVINCAGNAKKYFAEENYTATRLIEEKVLSRLEEISAKKIIHISSVNINDGSNYGLLKGIVEKRIQQIFPNFCILRLGGLVGDRLSKNVVYDLVNNNPLWVTLDSEFNFVNTSVVAKFVDYLIDHWKFQEIISIVANSCITVGEIAKIIKKVPQIREDARVEYCQVNNYNYRLQEFFKIEDSSYYVKQYIQGVSN